MTERPNLLLFMPDQLRADCVGAFGNDVVQTPAIDACYVERLYEGPELYDRRADPRETTNLAGQPEHAAVQHDLRDRIFRWLFETSDVIPIRRDPRFDDDLQRALFGG